MIVAGIDYSMSCPAVCIYDTSRPLTFKNCAFYFLIDKKKYEADFKNIHGFKTPLFEANEERFDNISEWAVQILIANKVSKACLEGYAMGASGQVFNIAENTGLLKHKMWKNGIQVITPAPTAVKKSFTGKGNAKKPDMYAALVESHDPLNLEELLGSTCANSPIADIVDSYAMVHHMVNNPDIHY